MYKINIFTLLTSLALAVSEATQPFSRSTPASRLISTEKAGNGTYYCGHTWYTWRDNLYIFAPLWFR